MSTAFEKYAHELALAATTGSRESLVSVAQPFIKTSAPNLTALLQDPTVQRYLLGGVGGAGLGALIGSAQPQKKKRNALMYALMGGAGGLGLAHILSGTAADNADAGANKNIGRQTAAETVAAARAQNLSPQEYVRRQGAAEASSAYTRALLLGDGGLADRATGGLIGSGAGRSGRALYRHIFGARDARGRLLPPPPQLTPAQTAQNIYRDLHTANRSTAEVRDTRLGRAQSALDSARTAVNAELKEISGRGADAAKATKQEIAAIRTQLAAMRANARREFTEALRSRSGAVRNSKFPDKIDPSPVLGGPFKNLDADYLAYRAATRAATDSAKTKVKTLADPHRLTARSLAQAAAAATNRLNDAETVAKMQQSAAQLDHQRRRTQNFQSARQQMTNLRTVGNRRGGTPIGRAVQIMLPYAPPTIGALLSTPSNIAGLLGFDGFSGTGAPK